MDEKALTSHLKLLNDMKWKVLIFGLNRKYHLDYTADNKIFHLTLNKIL